MNSEIQELTMEEHVHSFIKSGLSVRKYCEMNGIKEYTFRYWKAKVGKKKVRGKFKLVETSESPSVIAKPIMSLTYSNKTELHIYSLLDPDYIRQLM